MDAHEVENLIVESVFSPNIQKKRLARSAIWQSAQKHNIYPASMHYLYTAMAQNDFAAKFTVPAMNIRTLTFDLARAVFRQAKKQKVGFFVFEIARSEMGYTFQSPEEYSTCIMAAALAENWNGPVFIQGDHFQPKAHSLGVAKAGEIDILKKLIDEALRAGFYNIDIDTSTLVDLEKSTIEEQQLPNILNTLELAKYIRQKQPSGVTVSIGGEIGHIGGKNSTTEEFETYIQGFLSQWPSEKPGLSKISIQTGTSHGGTVDASGKVQNVEVDYELLTKVTKIAREKFGMGGAVQHGASTLSDEQIAKLPKADAIEVHFATGFQNLILDSPHFPQDLKGEMYAYIEKNNSSERKEGWTDEQFHYKIRKKALGPFKQKIWDMPQNAKVNLIHAFEKRIEFMFSVLQMENTDQFVKGYVKTYPPAKKVEDFGHSSISQSEDVLQSSELSD